MKRIVVNLIKTIATLMLVISIISIIVCIVQSNKANSGYFTRDPVAAKLWLMGLIPSISTFFGSFIVYGFSFVVEAACMYIDKRNQEIYQEEMDALSDTQE